MYNLLHCSCFDKKPENTGTKIRSFPCIIFLNSLFLCLTEGYIHQPKFNQRSMKTKPPTEKMMINNNASFEKWSKSVYSFYSKDTITTYVFDLPELSFRENIDLSTSVDQYSNTDGSKGKSGAITIVILLIVIHFIISGQYFSEITLYQVLSCSGMIILASHTGKAIDWIYAKWRLIKLAARIQKRLTGNKSTSSTIALEASSLLHH